MTAPAAPRTSTSRPAHAGLGRPASAGRPGPARAPAPAPGAAAASLAFFVPGAGGRGEAGLVPRPAAATPRWEAEADAVALRALRGGAGSEAGVRREVGSLLGFDFSGVRLHRESAAAAAEGAHAVAAGADVHLAPGRFRPDHPLGRALLAHELTHVAQQGAAPRLEAGASLPSLRRELPSAHLAERAATLFDPQEGLSPAPRGMRQRCAMVDEFLAPPDLDPREGFRANHTHLSAEELDRIERVVALAARDNEALRDSFFRYYSRRVVRKATDDEMAEWKEVELAKTKPGSDTLLRPSLLEASTSDETLAGLLIHEFTHTRHITSGAGAGDAQEGDAYGIEAFFARRLGNTKREFDIYELIMTQPGKLVLPGLELDLQRRYELHFAAMAGLYEVIDTGTSTRAGSPFTTPTPLTRDEARALAAELVATKEENRGARLKEIVTWVGEHLEEFPDPFPGKLRPRPRPPAPEPAPVADPKRARPPERPARGRRSRK